MREVLKGVRFVVLVWLGVFLFFGLIASAGANEVVAISEDGVGQRVELYAVECGRADVLARIEAERAAMAEQFGPIEEIREANYQRTEDGKVVERLDGCWFLHPAAPMVVMVWSGSGVGVVPVFMFESPPGK
jgi:hypothetical protein